MNNPAAILAVIALIVSIFAATRQPPSNVSQEDFERLNAQVDALKSATKQNARDIEYVSGTVSSRFDSPGMQRIFTDVPKTREALRQTINLLSRVCGWTPINPLGGFSCGAIDELSREYSQSQ